MAQENRNNSGPGPRPQKRERPKNVKTTLFRIFGYAREFKIHLAIVILCIIGSSLSTVAGTYFLKPIINDYVLPFVGHGNPDLSGFISMLFLMGGIYIIGIICSYSYIRLMVYISTSILKRIRVDMFSHMQKLPIKYYDTHTHGELMSRYTNDTDALREMLSNGIPQLISSSITVTGVFIMMLILSPVLSILVVIMLFIMLWSVKKIGGKSAKYFIRQQKALGKINGYIEEMTEGQKVIKVFNHESASKTEFDRFNEELRSSAASAHTFANILMPIMGNLSYINYALIATAGAALAINGYMDLGTIGSFLQYSRNFSMPITQVSQQFNSVLTALAGAERIFNLLDEAPEVETGDITLTDITINEAGIISEAPKHTGLWAWKEALPDGNIKFTPVKGDVRFNNVTFGYEEGSPVLNDISLFAKPGQKIAFVGATGAGKTTITNLINRFYDISHGNILYDGIDIKRIKKDDLRRSLAMVLQDTHLFTGTVMENIRYGRLNATDNAVIAAAKLANADSFIRHLPHGYETVLTSDGENLSQGQRQLLAIARAAIADPPVLILDEATSSIDTRTEALIEKGMDKLMEARTVFVIAHRLSTVRNSNAIMVLKNGKIIERGDHNDLIEQKGEYYKLYMGMFELT